MGHELSTFRALVGFETRRMSSPLFDIRGRGTVTILDIDLRIRQFARDLSQLTGPVAALDHHHVVFDHQRPMLFKHMKRLAVIADHQADDGVVHRVARRNGIDVNLGLGQGLASRWPTCRGGCPKRRPVV